MFTKFKILLKGIFNRKISYTYKRLIRNIKTGDIIEVNGKKYRKIKIAFVDSMSYTVSNHVDNLENEIHVLNAQLEKTHTEIEKLNKEKRELQIYNNNLIHKDIHVFNESNRRVEKIKSENELLNMRIFELDEMVASLKKKINTRDNNIKKHQEFIDKTASGDVKNYSDRMKVLLNENMSLKGSVSSHKISIENLVNKVALLQAKNNILEAERKEKKKSPQQDDFADL
jgi:chromosome segregation ATPase